jgi:hypothetical protein
LSFEINDVSIVFLRERRDKESRRSICLDPKEIKDRQDKEQAQLVGNFENVSPS